MAVTFFERNDAEIDAIRLRIVKSSANTFEELAARLDVMSELMIDTDYRFPRNVYEMIHRDDKLDPRAREAPS